MIYFKIACFLLKNFFILSMGSFLAYESLNEDIFSILILRSQKYSDIVNILIMLTMLKSQFFSLDFSTSVHFRLEKKGAQCRQIGMFRGRQQKKLHKLLTVAVLFTLTLFHGLLFGRSDGNKTQHKKSE